MSSKLKSTLAFTILILLIGIKLIGSQFPAGRMWGINQLAFLPRPLGFGLIAAICVGWLILWLRTRGQAETKSKKKPSTNTIGLIIGVVILGALFYIFRDRLNLLGDSYLRIEELQKKGLARLFADTPGEALDYFIHWVTYAYILKPLGLGALVSYQIWSITAGLIYTIAAWQISSKMRNYNIEPWLTLTWIMAWGGLMLFCGYAENYSLAAACLLLTIGFAIDYIRGGKKFLLMMVVFLLAFFFHNLTVIILPAIWYAVLIQAVPLRKKGIIPLLILTLITAGYIIGTRIGSPEGTLILFDSVSEPGYTLFSAAHLIDILNQLLLVSPMFIAVLLFGKYRGQPNAERKRLIVFAGIAALAGMAALFFIDPKLGLARDWDLFALPLLTFHLAIFISADWREVGKPLKSGLAIISVGFTFIWILVNSNQAWALSRYQQIAGIDKLRGGYNYEVLGDYFYNQQNYAAAEDAFAKSVTCKHHQRCYVWLGHVQMWQKKYGPAEKNLLEANRLNPDEPNALDYLSRLYFQTNRFPQAKEYLDRYAKTPEGARNPEVKHAQAYLDSVLAHPKK